MFGALTTIPLAAEILSKGRSAEGAGMSTNGRMGVKDRSGTGVSATNVSAQP